MSLVSNKSKNKNIFLSTNSKIQTHEKVDIILSPEFYWVRIFEIPVKNIMQARHVLPTLFEDILENVTELSYQVIKLKNNKYLCFAYINRRIYEAIKKSGISLSLVNGIYFAQNECTNYEQFKNEGKSFLYTEDGILVKVPNLLASQSVELSKDIDSIVLSSNKVDIKLYNNVLSTKQIYSIVFVLIVISIMNIYKLFDYKNEVLVLEDKIQEIRLESKLPNSSIQTNSILKNNSRKIQNEIKKRDFLEYILVNESLKLKEISLNRDIITLVINTLNRKNAEDYISNKYKILSINDSSPDLNIRIKL